MAKQLKLLPYKDDIIKKYQTGKYTCIDLGHEYNCHAVTIRLLLKTFNIPVIGAIESSSLLRHRIGDSYDQFEKIDSEEKAYFLGLLITDGCVYSPTVKAQKQIKLQLDIKDAYMLESLKNYFNASQEITYSCGLASIGICSDKMANDLELLGVVERKTNITILPAISDEFMPHLIRGIWDGDGCFTKPSPGRSTATFQLCSASMPFIQAIDAYLIKAGVIIGGSWCSYETYFSYNLYKKKDVISFGHYIYDKANIYLTRKKFKVDSYMKKGVA